MSTSPAVLLIDDDSDALESLARALKAHGLTTSLLAASNAQKALALAEQHSPAVAIVDLSLSPREGVEGGFALIREILMRDSSCRVIVLTGHGSSEHGVRALSLGAASFVDKPADTEHLLALITDGLKQAALRRDYQRLLRASQARAGTFMIGESPAMREVAASIEYASATNQSVLITGETGTGKGLCALAIHKLSTRSGRNFIRYQPSFGASDLVHSDLYGHLKGAFTGAAAERRGLLEEAHGGTIFFDEVDELPVETQIGLLGVLQDRCFRPVGSSKEQQVDVRVICATNQDPLVKLEQGKLRSDFFHRIAHFRIHLPRLSDRREDIPLLAAHFVARLLELEGVKVAGCTEAALEILKERDWPGNVRQLQAVIEGGAYRAQYHGRTYIEPQDFENHQPHGSSSESGGTFHEQVQVFKLRLIESKLAEVGGNQVQAARALGIDRSSLRRLLESRRASR